MGKIPVFEDPIVTSNVLSKSAPPLLPVPSGTYGSVPAAWTYPCAI